MRNKLLITATLAGLIAVGAGCESKTTPPESTTTLPAIQQEAKIDPVDSNVDAILNDADGEAGVLEGEAGEMNQLNAADGEVQAFSESVYEVK
ncbi:MAG: hypothetical protein WCT10_02465 [Patescibacteria group bacterium]|jgi:hypothetical protein